MRPSIELLDAVSGAPVSFFEAVTALGFLTFAAERVDVAVVEVGMGGRWDATNVADGRVAVVTPISLDHTELLGPDEISIAREKAGIIKPAATVVLAEQCPDVMEVLVERARLVGADVAGTREGVRTVGRTPRPDGQLLHPAGWLGRYPETLLPLLGAHQAQNAARPLAPSRRSWAGRDARSIPWGRPRRSPERSCKGAWISSARTRP